MHCGRECQESILAICGQSGTPHDTHAEVVLANGGRSACGLLVTMLENLGSRKTAPIIQDAPVSELQPADVSKAQGEQPW